jgi:hypothetical protein
VLSHSSCHKQSSTGTDVTASFPVLDRTNSVVERLKRLQVAMFNVAMQLLNRVSSVDRVSSLDDRGNVVRIPVSLRDISVV